MSIQKNDQLAETPRDPSERRARQEQHSEKPLVEVRCPERPEIAQRVSWRLSLALAKLGIPAEKFPDISVVFEPSDGAINRGRTRVHGDGSVEVVFDERLATSEGESLLNPELGPEFPGFEQVLMHEVGHMALWSVTGMPRQPATRLLDEGWARLIEETGMADGGLVDISRQAKRKVREGLSAHDMNVERCIDFARAITQGESASLNAAEYDVGEAFLLWVRERWGNEGMVLLLRGATASVRRNDDLPEGVFDPVVIDHQFHGEEGARTYAHLQEVASRLPVSQLVLRATEWESSQFVRMLLSTTKLASIKEVREEFLRWVQSDDTEHIGMVR